MPENEVKHTAKSVAKWTHKHFSPSAFSAWQAKQGAKGGKASKRPTKTGLKKENILNDVIKLKKSGWSNRKIAVELKIGSATVSRYLRGIND